MKVKYVEEYVFDWEYNSLDEAAEDFAAACREGKVCPANDNSTFPVCPVQKPCYRASADDFKPYLREVETAVDAGNPKV